MRTKTRGSTRKNLKKGEICGLSLFGRDMVGVLKIVKSWLEGQGEKGIKMVATVNPEFVMKAQKEPDFREILNQADLRVVDGIGLIWARELEKRFMKYDLRLMNKTWKKFFVRVLEGFWVGVEVLRGQHKNRVVTGVELMDKLCGLGYGVGFLGGWSDRAKRTNRYFENKYENFTGVAIGSEYDGKIAEILDILDKNNIKILLVAYGMGQQEKWIATNKEALKRAGVRVVMGVGRSFDYYSGDLPRAPEWVRRMGFEWLYSLIREPKRWRRQLVLPAFIWRVLTEWR